jgi:uncharacterized damage-inducible protein DinB
MTENLEATMNTFADRFRRWYEYERDCNAKTLAMLASVPEERRAAPEFQKAVDRMAHLVAARQWWLHHLANGPEAPELFPQGTRLDDLPGLVTAAETAWGQYLAPLDDAGLAREIEWQMANGRRYRWTVEGVLTQLFGHAWYHRGQIAQLVAGLGGKAVDSDYIFWSRPIRVHPPG